MDGIMNLKKEKDKNRQEYLESLGIKFFRVSDFDVKKNMMLVLQDLENFIINQYKL
jgi:very-short-patch-repair endonuclease